MSPPTRARVFVLREKQREIAPFVEDITDAFFQTIDDDRTGSVRRLRQQVRERFQVDLEDYSDIDICDWAMSSIDGLIAKKVLDQNPPNTRPPWDAPWPEFGPPPMN